MKKTAIGMVIFVIMLSVSLFAENSETQELFQAPQQEAPTRKLVRREEKVSFSELTLKGKLKKPDLSYIYRRKGLRAEQIVNIPEDFNEEIIQGAGQF
jgi:hypothetical protein